MKLSLLLVVTGISLAYSYHMVIGNVNNRVRLYNETVVEYNAIPFMKRVKYYFVALPGNEKIQGIQALDNLKSTSSINITAGGVGHSFANLRLKSERGRGINYNIGVYVSDNLL
ncbi:uncharacterized protein LOC115456455 isoform X2 [Manduca sexta]|uniref:uncharacterized protein LOC115456455 isoform X2 n=1 Tax=Manduca sexta TaxID=7130 RepID=UPI00188EB57C|nr:uncharacterized protein LOC115456455 isoform X2 [Manduca sexta]